MKQKKKKISVFMYKRHHGGVCRGELLLLLLLSSCVQERGRDTLSLSVCLGSLRAYPCRACCVYPQDGWDLLSIKTKGTHSLPLLLLLGSQDGHLLFVFFKYFLSLLLLTPRANTVKDLEN